MESLGQRKALLSEKLKQRQEQELGEVEKLAQALLETLRRDLQTRISGELNTTVTAIRGRFRKRNLKYVKALVAVVAL